MPPAFPDIIPKIFRKVSAQNKASAKSAHSSNKPDVEKRLVRISFQNFKKTKSRCTTEIAVINRSIRLIPGSLFRISTCVTAPLLLEKNSIFLFLFFYLSFISFLPVPPRRCFLKTPRKCLRCVCVFVCCVSVCVSCVCARALV